MKNKIDHLVITAPSLAVGAQYVRDCLGVELEIGGEHQRMGTHNLLLRLGEDQYLEVIAVNPHAQTPMRPRWFGLDEVSTNTRAKLITWVVRTDQIFAVNAHCGENLGVVEPMSRAALNWQITIPTDGQLPLSGIAPVLIEWEGASHPAHRLKDAGFSLLKLELHHPEPERIARLIRALQLECPIEILPTNSTVFLRAQLATPNGVAWLE